MIGGFLCNDESSEIAVKLRFKDALNTSRKGSFTAISLVFNFVANNSEHCVLAKNNINHGWSTKTEEVANSLLRDYMFVKTRFTDDLERDLISPL